MTLSVLSNYAASVAHQNLVNSENQATDSIAKLSSGSRIVQASDDPASLAIGSGLSAEVAALNQASINAGQATSVLQIADGAYSNINSILVQLKALAIQASSGQLSGTQRGQLNTEYQSLVDEVNRIANVTDFNGTSLINGSFSISTASASDFTAAQGVDDITLRGAGETTGNYTIAYSSSGDTFTLTNPAGTTFTGSVNTGALNSTSTALTQGTVVTLTSSASTDSIDLVLGQNFLPASTVTTGTLAVTGTNSTNFSFQVGAGTTSNDQIGVTLDSATASSLGIANSDITSEADAQNASTLITNAINQLGTTRANLGAAESRLQFATSNISTASENLQSAESNLMDVDVASETSVLSSKQILVQLGVAELAQANQLPQYLLKLFP